MSFISNSSYLAGRSHPIMRESLLGSFNAVWIDNLHGNRLASERTPWGDSCETIFNTEEIGPGIKVGTSISTFIKKPKVARSPAGTTVFLRDFWGRAAAKRRALLDAIEMSAWSKKRLHEAAALPEGPRPYEEFNPSDKTRWRLVPYAAVGGFEEWPSLDELFPTYFQGVNHNRGMEGGIVEINSEPLEERMQDYFSDLSWAKFREKHPVLCQPRAEYEPEQLRRELKRATKYRPEQIVPYEVFPLDVRWIYYETEGQLLNRRRPELWEHLKHNEFLVTVPQPRRVSESRPLVVACLFDLHLHDRGSLGFPAYVRVENENGALFERVAKKSGQDDDNTRANVAPSAWTVFKKAWNVAGNLDGKAAKRLVRRLFGAAMAICHAPQYELDHQVSLSQDWAHIPFPKAKKVMEALADLGDRVAVLLDPRLNAKKTITDILDADTRHLGVPAKIGGGSIGHGDIEITYSYYGSAAGRWEARGPKSPDEMRTEWGDTTGDLYLNEKVYLTHVPEKVWKYELGGYPVIKKWLGYRDAGRRPGVPLTMDELEHLRSMVQRIAALLVLHSELDQAYENAVAEAFTAEDLGLR